MFRSSGSQRFQSNPKNKSGCCCIQEYENQISILQDKLMEVHTKLMEQLDVCQQQQLTIIELTKKLMALQQNYLHDLHSSQSLVSSNLEADVSRDSQQISKSSVYLHKHCQFTLNNSNPMLLSNYNSPTFLQNNRNELLKEDLEAMRLKLMQEVTEKASLKEELNQLKIVHNQKMIENKKQVKDLQNDHEFLLKQYEYIKLSLQKGNLKKNDKNYTSGQIVELNEKCVQFERLYKKEVNLNQELNQKINELKSMIGGQKQKIRAIEEELDKYTHCIKSTSTNADGLKEQREELCGTIRITNKNPGTLWEKDSNKSKISQTHTQNDFFKKRNTLSQLNYQPQRQVDSAKQNKENIHESVSSIKSLNKDKSAKNSKKQDYESTKQLIRKLEEAEMITRQRRKTGFA